MKRNRSLAVMASFLTLAAPASAKDLYRPGTFPALASDQSAAQVGDVITILVYENASATNSASTNTKKSTKIDGHIAAGSRLNESGSLGLGGSSDNAGSIGRSGQMIAQISATVEEVLPNGDLRVAGNQELNVSGEHTHIRVMGRVRRADISPANAVLSSRVADARIEYDGKGFASRGAKPGIVSRIFGWLGLL
jgi:flagellar L-ring protein precursor FlgH